MVRALAAQLFGTVNSHLVVYAAMQPLVYRLFFDFRIGAFSLGAIVAGTWAVVLAETHGWLRAAHDVR